MKTWALVFSTKRVVRRYIYDDDYLYIHLSSTNKHSSTLLHITFPFLYLSLSPYIYFDHAYFHVSSLLGKDQHHIKMADMSYCLMIVDQHVW